MLGHLDPFWKWSTLKFKELVLYTISFWNHVNYTKIGMQLTSIEIHTALIAEHWGEGKEMEKIIWSNSSGGGKKGKNLY